MPPPPLFPLHTHKVQSLPLKDEKKSLCVWPYFPETRVRFMTSLTWFWHPVVINCHQLDLWRHYYLLYLFIKYKTCLKGTCRHTHNSAYQMSFITHWGIPSSDGIPLRGCRLFFFFVVFFFSSAALLVAVCCEENNGLGWNFAQPYLWTCFRSR